MTQITWQIIKYSNVLQPDGDNPMSRDSKVYSEREVVLKFLSRVSMLAIGGMHMHNNPMSIIREMIRRKAKIKTLLTSPSGSINADMLIGANCVEEVILSYIGFEHYGLAPNFRKFAEQKLINIRECDEARVVLGLRAGASRVPFYPLPEGLERTDIWKANNVDYQWLKDPFSGKDILVTKALNPEVAIIHCQKADEFGNAQFLGSLFTDFEMAKAAEHVIVVTECIVPPTEISKNPRLPTIPAFMVDAVIEAPFGCHPTSSHAFYNYDDDHFKEYIQYAKTNFEEYLKKYVYSCSDHQQYIELIGVDKLDKLRFRWG